jgi:hypothetical protein
MQRDPQWFAKRAGKITGSAADDVMNVLKSGEPGANRKNLVTRLAVERLLGQCVDTFQNDAMRRGIELEAEARAAYEAHTGEIVELVDFTPHPTLAFVGVSPDGRIGTDGLAEFKCPASMHKHMSALLVGDHATEYRWQLQHQLWVEGRAWVDAVSYDPRFPEGLRLAIVRVTRDDVAIKRLEEQAKAVNVEVEEAVAKLLDLQARAA